ncbi:hypothetical protein [Vibrio misgurnus]|uniref:hypothetical protein n=1 Tax=Vibrio misgurnus TaxID=2993714 RepID=UPI00241654C5|nr:hypothetical protein [Vibrio sp. gvc]
MAQCFRVGWRRCSPLNWALVSIKKIINIGAKYSEKLSFSAQNLRIGFSALFDADWVESVENIAGTRSLKPTNLDASILWKRPHGKFGFTKAATLL